MTKKHETKPQDGIKDDLQKQLEDCAHEKSEMKDLLQRLQADFENYRKHCEKSNTAFMKNSNRALIKEMLPIFDSFEMALKNTGNHEVFVKGMELLYSQFFNTLKQQGLKKIDVAGKKFDHNLHEVLLKQESVQEEDTILEELQAGYMLNDSVLRYTKVKIATTEKDGKHDEQKEAEKSHDKQDNKNS